MADPTTRRRPLALAGLSAIVATAFGTLFYAFSVLVAKGAAGADFSTSALSLAYGGTVLIGGGLAFVIGPTVDRTGVRRVMGAGSLLGAAGLAGLAISTENWHIVAASWLLIGPAGAMTFYEPAFVAVNQWFAPNERGRAIGMLTVVGGLAGPVFLPLSAGLVESFGWRSGAVALGVILASVGLISAGFAIPTTTPAGTDDPESPAPVRLSSLARDRRFVWYTVSVLLTYASFQTVLFHRIALWEQAGLALALVSFWAGFSGWLSFPGRYLGPILAGGRRGIWWNAATTALLALTVVPAVTTGGTVAMIVHFCGFGFVFGAVLPMRAAVMGRWFGGASFGRVMGRQWTLAALAGASGPFLAGVSRDAVGDYRPAMTAVVVALALATVCMGIAGRHVTAD